MHPHCNACGGGEKVLMCMLSKLQNQDKYDLAIYSAENLEGEEIINKANQRFNRHLEDNIEFIQVLRKNLLEPTKRWTMFCQIVGQMIFVYHCINKYQPDVYLDSTGLPFTYLVVRLLLPKAKIIAYVHYPFISYDMIDQVRSRKNRFNNDENITNSILKTKAKLIYYKLILILYKMCGYFVHYAYANSTWTYNHMKQLWTSTQLIKLFPPCTVDAFMKRKQFTDKFIIVSFAQYRPEKQHKLQIEIIEQLKSRLPSEISQSLCLYMIGSVRNEQDELLFSELYSLIEQKGLQNNIKMYKNPHFSEVVTLLTQGMIGLHTMEYEHFGISLVEMLAAGLIVVAHDSAGPKYDILRDGIGYLSENLEDYVMNIVRIMQLSDDDRLHHQIVGRRQAVKFSDESFMEDFQIII